MKNKILFFVFLVILFFIVALYSSVSKNENVKVHFIDVGQGDAILIQSIYGNMLIDGGSKSAESKLIRYMKEHNIQNIDYIVATHPHSDHVGGLEKIIRTYPVDNIIMPKVNHSTVVYQDFLQAIVDTGTKVIKPVAGDVFMMGDIKFEILAPISDVYQSLNDYSVVIKMEYGKTSFLFTGDIENISEQEILRANYNISADVLKVAHHGSNTSSTPDFIKKVNPVVSVITVGLNNQYNLPSQSTIDTLNYFDSIILRTDLMGSIVMETNGEYITYITEK